MISVQGRDYSCRKRLFIAFFDFSFSLESEFSKQPAKFLGSKSLATITNVSKYSKDDLQ